MDGWLNWPNGHEFEQALGVDDGQGGLVCCSPWGHKELDTTELLNFYHMEWKLVQAMKFLSSEFQSQLR